MNVVSFCSSLSIPCWLCQWQSGGLAGSLVWPSMSVLMLKSFIYSRCCLLMLIWIILLIIPQWICRGPLLLEVPVLDDSSLKVCCYCRSLEQWRVITAEEQLCSFWHVNWMKVYRKWFVLAFNWWHEIFLPFLSSLILLSVDLLSRSMRCGLGLFLWLKAAGTLSIRALLRPGAVMCLSSSQYVRSGISPVMWTSLRLHNNEPVF